MRGTDAVATEIRFQRGVVKGRGGDADPRREEIENESGKNTRRERIADQVGEGYAVLVIVTRVYGSSTPMPTAGSEKVNDAPSVTTTFE